MARAAPGWVSPTPASPTSPATAERLAALDAEQARLVELRFFGGLTIEETADAMAISPATVKRPWTVARAWLARELEGRSPA